MQEALPQVEVANRLAVSAKQVRRLTKQKGMPRNDDGSYPWPEVADWYKAFKQEEVLRRKNLDDLPDPDKMLARKRKIEADIKELELRRKKGDLIPRHAVLESRLEVYTKMRSRWENVPGRRAKELAAAETPAEVTAILEQDAQEIFEELQSLLDESENGDGGK